MDRYTTYEWLIVIGVFVLSLADLVLTLVFLAKGGVEANPIMAMVCKRGDGVFTAVKMGTTFLCLLVLLIHVRFRRIDFLLAFSFLLYAAVFFYHQIFVPGI